MWYLVEVARRLTRTDVEQHLTVKAIDDGPSSTVRSLGGGVWAWLPRSAVYDDPARPVVVAVTIDFDDAGTLGCSSVTISPRNGRVIRPGDERIPLGLVIEATSRWSAFLEGPESAVGAFAPAGTTETIRGSFPLDYAALERQASRAAGRRPRQRATDAVLQRVAETYRNPPEGQSRRKAVADVFTVSQSRANKLIQEAREKHFLGPAPGPRQAGEIEPPKDTAKKRRSKP
jgi:hypothetical protein